MKWILLLLVPGGLLIGAWWLWQASRDMRVSDHWLDDHERRSNGLGIDGVSWRWPVNKRRDEAADFNRYRLRA